MIDGPGAKKDAPSSALLSDFDDDELLSIGQSAMYGSEFTRDDEDFDKSIYLHTSGATEPHGTEIRALALYDVKHNFLGLDCVWPGKEDANLGGFR